MSRKVLPQRFYERDALDVARDLLGMHVRNGSVEVRITEAEAYRFPDDTANHCRFGRTRRNAPMWGPPGHAYVYLCYGIHHLLNLVTNADGEGAAVLVRAAEPVRGIALMRERRRGAEGVALLAGPGRVGEALGLDTSYSGKKVFGRGPFQVLEGREATSVRSGPRIGIGYASTSHKRAPWRVAIAESPWVTHPSRLT